MNLMTQPNHEEEMDKIKVQLARHDERIRGLEEAIDKNGEVLKEIQAELKHVTQDLISRPSWMITFVFSALFTMVGTLIVYIVTNA